MTTRREFLERSVVGVASANGLRLPIFEASPPPRGFLDIQRSPDAVIVQTATEERRLTRAGDQWTNENITVTTANQRIRLSSPSIAIKRIHLRWRGDLHTVRSILGDAWERGYGDLEWRSWVPDRVMPWYVATYDGMLTHAYGVRTGARSFSLSVWLRWAASSRRCPA